MACPICLDEFDQARMAQVCPNNHRVCHDCFGATMAADEQAASYGHKTGCYCGEPYHAFGAEHPAPETLPREFRLRVREAQDEAQGIFAPGSDPADYESDPEYPLLYQNPFMDWAYEPAPVFQNGIRDVRAPDRIGHKRTIEEMDMALSSIADDHVRDWKTACRIWNRETGRLRTRIWRSKKNGASAEAIQELKLKLTDWNATNPKPRRDEFAPPLPELPEGTYLADIFV